VRFWLSEQELRRFHHELERKGLSGADWFREALAQSEAERLLRGTEFVRQEIEEEAVILAEWATAERAEQYLFAADRHRGSRPEDLKARHELRQQAQPWLEASAYWQGVLVRFRRMRDRLDPARRASATTSAKTALRTVPPPAPGPRSPRGWGAGGPTP
jgi:hypothetical protein